MQPSGSSSCWRVSSIALPFRRQIPAKLGASNSAKPHRQQTNIKGARASDVVERHHRAETVQRGRHLPCARAGNEPRQKSTVANGEISRLRRGLGTQPANRPDRSRTLRVAGARSCRALGRRPPARSRRGDAVVWPARREQTSRISLTPSATQTDGRGLRAAYAAAVRSSLRPQVASAATAARISHRPARLMSTARTQRRVSASSSTFFGNNGACSSPSAGGRQSPAIAVDRSMRCAAKHCRPPEPRLDTSRDGESTR